jgi:flavin-dependent dehydrogenase
MKVDDVMKPVLSLMLALALSLAGVASRGAQAPQFITVSARQVPVAATVDVVVVGGSSAAVAAASEAARTGARVCLLAPRPYLGEDLAGTMRLWLEPGESAKGTPAEPIWKDGKTFVTPLELKDGLARKLQAAKVEFYFGAYPSDLLVDGAGKPCGVVMANRSGRQAVIAKEIIDATEYAVVARLAGARFTEFKGGPQTVKWVTIADKARTGEGMSARKLDLPLQVMDKNGVKPVKSAAAWFEYTMQLNLADEGWAARAALEQQVRDLAYDPSQLYSSDVPFLVPATAIKGVRSASGKAPLEKMDLGVYRPAGVERVWVLSGRADVPRATAEQLLRPVAFMQAGARVGKAAAAEAKKEALAELSTIKVAVAADAGAAQAGEVKESLAGMRPLPASARLPQAAVALPVLGSYDVVVIGGGTAGGPAGIGAARRGAKTLVVEYLSGLGGVGTLGMIDVYWYGNRVGFTTTMPQFPLEPRMEWYRAELRKAKADVWLGSIGCGTLMQGNRAAGVVVATPQGRGVVLAKVVIDATGNADTAIAGGAAYEYVGDDFALQNAHMARREVGAWYINGNRPAVANADPVDTRNALLDHKMEADDLGRKKGAKVKTSFDWSQVVDTRERRHIVGDYQLDWLDEINERTFPDTIVRGTSDYDSHGYQIHPYFALRPARIPGDYKHPFFGNLPYRCLLPKGMEGMLVVGIGMSVHRDALPIVRMQPDLQNQGYAAGYAAAMAAESGVTPRQIDVKTLQKHLVEIGNLAPSVLTDQDSYPLPKAKVAEAVLAVKKNFEKLEVLLAQPQDALPLLHQAYTQAEGMDKVAYAEVLGVMGDATGLPTLEAEAARLLKAQDALAAGVDPSEGTSLTSQDFGAKSRISMTCRTR